MEENEDLELKEAFLAVAKRYNRNLKIQISLLAVGALALSIIFKYDLV